MQLLERLIVEVFNRPAIWQSKLPQHKFKNVVKKQWVEIQQCFPEFEVDDLKKKWKNLKDTFRRELKKYHKLRTSDPTSDYHSQWKYYEQLEFLREENMPLDDEVPQGTLMEYVGVTETSVGPQSTTKPDILDTKVKVEYSSPVPPFGSSNDEDSVSAPTSPGSPQPCKKEPTQSQPEATISQTKRSDSPNISRKRFTPNQIRAEYLEIEKKKLKLLKNELVTRESQEFKKSGDYHFLMSLLPQIEKLSPMQKMRLRNKFNQALMDEMALMTPLCTGHNHT